MPNYILCSLHKGLTFGVSQGRVHTEFADYQNKIKYIRTDNVFPPYLHISIGLTALLYRYCPF